MDRLKDKNNNKKSVKETVKVFLLTISASKVLAENVDYIADKYLLDRDTFADAVEELFEIAVTSQ